MYSGDRADSRVPGAVQVHPRLRALPTPEQRVRFAFRWVRPALDRPRRRPSRLEPRPHGRYVPASYRAATRYADGERCIVPGCRRDLTTQHDHFHEVHAGGTADLARDHRLCGACNRAKHRGLIRLEALPNGMVHVTDGRGRAFGTVQLAPDLDAPLLAWCWAAAEREVLAANLGNSCAIETNQERTSAAGAASGPPALLRTG